MRTARSAFSKAGGVVLSERAFYAYQSTLNSYFFKVFLDRPLNHLAELFEWMGPGGVFAGHKTKRRASAVLVQSPVSSAPFGNNRGEFHT